jgi:alkylglycerol monooxygenase
VWANFDHWNNLRMEWPNLRSWKDKIFFLFKKPGWRPEYLGGPMPIPEVDKNSYKKFDTEGSLKVNLYVLFQYVVTLAGTALFLFQEKSFGIADKVLISALIVIAIFSSGAFFEKQKNVMIIEVSRLLISAGGLIFLAGMEMNTLFVITIAVFAISMIWLFLIKDEFKFENKAQLV